MKGKEIDNRSSEVQFLDQIINLVSFFYSNRVSSIVVACKSNAGLDSILDDNDYLGY